MNVNEAKEIFLQSLPELSEPLKSAVEFMLANWKNLVREPRASDVAINFFASMPFMPTNDVDLTFAAKLNEMVNLLRYDSEVWLSLEILPHEEWRDITGYEGHYQVSNYGRVKSFINGGRSLIRRLHIDKSGYAYVDLNRNRTVKVFVVHVLVARAFIPNFEEKPQVNHRIPNKANNCVFNLEWVTQLENMKHAIKMGLIKTKRGTEHPDSKLIAEQIHYIREHYVPRDKEFGARALARKFNVCPATIINVIEYKTYNDVV